MIFQRKPKQSQNVQAANGVGGELTEAELSMLVGGTISIKTKKTLTVAGWGDTDK